MNRDRFRFFQCSLLETDLLIGIPPEQFRSGLDQVVMDEIRRVRDVIETYGGTHPEFFTSLEPLPQTTGVTADGRGKEVPDEIGIMLRCGEQTGTGPMSAVAGLLAEKVGSRLIMDNRLSEVVIENGGDLFMVNSRNATAVIQAGNSSFSGKIALDIPPGTRGICTSSGTVGHSFSYGKADAVTVVAGSAPLADAWATSLANHVKTPADIEFVLAHVEKIPDILGCVVVIGERMGIRGQFELKPLS
jgi:ApbE superfamily uncharacterized protein (UPF0280 family)